MRKQKKKTLEFQMELRKTKKRRKRTINVNYPGGGFYGCCLLLSFSAKVSLLLESLLSGVIWNSEVVFSLEIHWIHSKKSFSKMVHSSDLFSKTDFWVADDRTRWCIDGHLHFPMGYPILLTQCMLGLGMPSASHSKVALSPSLTSTKLPPSVLTAITEGGTQTSK